MPKKHSKFSNEEHWGFKSQVELFEYIWIRDGGVCRITGVPLDQFYHSDLRYNCCAHILPKGRYTYFRLNPSNVLLIHPNLHFAIDHGSSDYKHKYFSKESFDKWDEIVEYKKIEYEHFKHENLL